MNSSLPYLVFLFFIVACQPQVNTVITAKFTNPNIGLEEMLLAKEQVEKRLGNLKAMNSKVELDEVSKTLQFLSGNKVSVEQTRKFNSLFKKSKFEIRRTIDLNRHDLKDLISSLPEIKGFKMADSAELSIESSIVGYIDGEENEENTLHILNRHFSVIEDVKVMTLKSPNHNDRKSQLHLVNMSPTENYITQSHITRAGSFKSEIDNSLQVKVSLNHRGAKNLAQMTTIASQNNNSSVALLFNNQILSAPRVNGPITSGIITIAYNGDKEEKIELGDILSMGPLSYDLEVVP